MPRTEGRVLQSSLGNAPSRSQCAHGSACPFISGEITLWQILWVAPICKELRIRTRPEVGAIWIQSPPFSVDDHAGLVAITDELWSSFFLCDPRNRIRPFGQLGCEHFQTGGHLLYGIVSRAAAIRDGICDVEARIQTIDASVVNLD